MAYDKRLGFDPSDVTTFNYRSGIEYKGKFIELKNMTEEDKAKTLSRAFAPAMAIVNPGWDIKLDPECYNVDYDKYLEGAVPIESLTKAGRERLRKQAAT